MVLPLSFRFCPNRTEHEKSTRWLARLGNPLSHALINSMQFECETQIKGTLAGQVDNQLRGKFKFRLRMSLLYLFGGCFFLTTPNGTLVFFSNHVMRAQHSKFHTMQQQQSSRMRNNEPMMQRNHPKRGLDGRWVGGGIV